MVSNMGYLKQGLGEFDAAERFYLESLETRRRMLGNDHADTLVSELKLAKLYIERGEPAAGEPLLLHAVGVRRRDNGEAHPAPSTPPTTSRSSTGRSADRKTPSASPRRWRNAHRPNSPTATP